MLYLTLSLKDEDQTQSSKLIAFTLQGRGIARENSHSLLDKVFFRLK